MGPLNTATYVSVGGQYQGIWDADTKLDKITTPAIDGGYKVYAVDDIGDQATIDFTGSVESHAGVMRGGYGEIYVPEWPEFPNEATSKMYVDGLIVDSPTIKTMWEGPDLSLNLSADIVAEIDRSLKMPVEAPSANSFVRITTDGQQQLVPQSNYVLASSQAYTTRTTNVTAVPMKAGYKYTFYPNATGSLAITFTPQGSTSTQTTANVYKAELMCISTNYAILTISTISSQGSMPISRITQLSGSQFITFESFNNHTIPIS